MQSTATLQQLQERINNLPDWPVYNNRLQFIEYIAGLVAESKIKTDAESDTESCIEVEI